MIFFLRQRSGVLLQRRILGDFMRIPRVLWQKITPTLIFSFSHNMSEANASYCGVKRNNASERNEMACRGVMKWRRELLHLKRRFYEAHLRCMKQSSGLWSTPVGVWRYYERHKRSFTFLSESKKSGLPLDKNGFMLIQEQRSRVVRFKKQEDKPWIMYHSNKKKSTSV